jgi:hypothetical protein
MTRNRGVYNFTKIATISLLVLLTIALVCCDVDEIGNPTIVSIAVKPANSLGSPDSSVQFTINATFSDGAIINNWNPDAGFTWASSNASTAAIDQSGLATTVAAGNTTITASYSPEDGDEISGSTTLTVVLDATSISISPSSASVDAGDVVQLSVTAVFEDDSQGDVTTWASWSSDNQAIARVFPGGRVTGISVGNTTINVGFGLLTDSITVTVNPAPENPEVVEAIAVAQLSYGLGIFVALFGDPIDELDFNETTAVLTFTDFDISESEMGYSTVSGTVGPTPDGSIDFDLAFTGGPISSLQFTLTSEQTEALDVGESVSIVATADGEEYTVTLESTIVD